MLRPFLAVQLFPARMNCCVSSTVAIACLALARSMPAAAWRPGVFSPGPSASVLQRKFAKFAIARICAERGKLSNNVVLVAAQPLEYAPYNALRLPTGA